MEAINKFYNLSLNTIYNIKYNRSTEYEKFLYVNKTNKITNFNLNYITKQKPIYSIENKSFQYSDFPFSIQKTDNITLRHLIDETLEDTHNISYNPFISTQNKNKNIHLEFFSYNKPIKRTDNNRTIKILTQKRDDDSFISTIHKESNSSFMDKNIFESSNENKNKLNFDNMGSIQPNKNMLQSLNLMGERREEKEFLNSINNSNILNHNLISPNERKINNLRLKFDEKGYFNNSNGTDFDDDDYFGDKEFYKNKERDERLGEYIPNSDLNTELIMNNKDINNLSFTQEKLKNELDDINKNEFEKTKLGKENKQLKQNLFNPIEKDDDCDSLNITEEFEKLDKSYKFESEILPNHNLQEEDNKNDIVTRFFNGEFNTENFQNVTLKEKQKFLKMENEQNNDELFKTEEQKEEEFGIEYIKEEKIGGKRKGKKRRISKDSVLTKKNQRKISKDKNKKGKKKIIDNNINNNSNDNVNNENNKTKKSKIKDSFPKTNQITEENLNQQTEVEDIDSNIVYRKLLEEYG